MKCRDFHVGGQLKVVSNLPGGKPGLQDQCYGLGPTVVPGTIWAEGGVLVGSPLNYPIPNIPEAALMVGRAPLTNPLAKVAVSILKVTNKGGLSPIDKINPLDIWLGDPGVGVVGITINSSVITIVNGSAITITSPNVSFFTNKFHVGAQADAGAQAETGLQAEAGAEVRAGSKVDNAPTRTINGNLTVNGKFHVNGKASWTSSIVSVTKRFDIPHPTKGDAYRLNHGCLEGPELGVYIRGKLDGSHIIEIPEYWKGLVDYDTITVQLTPFGKPDSSLHVKEIGEDKIILSSDHLVQVKCFYQVYGERKDVDKLVVEYKGTEPRE